MKRVVITGQGSVNALGHSAPKTMEAMREGRCGIGPLNFRDVERLAIRIGGQVTGYDAEDHFNRQQIALYDRFTQFTLLAAREAIEQSGLTFSGDLSAQAGVVLGTAAGGVSTWDENYRAVYEEGKNRVHPFVVPKLMTTRRPVTFPWPTTSRVRRLPWPRPVPRQTTRWDKRFS